MPRRKKHKRQKETPNENTTFWREWRGVQMQERAVRRVEGAEAIMALRDKGYSVEQMSPYQYRVNDRLDLYPTGRKFHDLRHNVRGRYLEPLTVAQQLLGTPDVGQTP